MSDIKPIQNDHSGEWHAEKFVEFARAKAAIGEPVPHMRVVDYLCAGCSTEESMWRAGLYLAAYSVVAGEGDMPSFGTALEAVRSFAANNPGLLDQARAAASTRRLAVPS